MAVLAIDYGDRHVGLALTSPEGLPVRHSTIDWDDSDIEALFGQLLDHVAQNDVSHVVVGIPRNLSGELTEQSEEVNAFFGALESQLPKGVTASMVDETLSSAEARKRLEQEGVAAEEEHAEAAKVILEDYLRQHPDKT